MSTLGTGFGRAVGDYQRGRPGYPADAVAWLLHGVTGPVADVGAGTGKLTAEVRRLGFDVTAVDPDEHMLAALRDALPAVPTVVGTGESLPFASGSLGALTYGQSWHWVDVPRASAQAARVLRPGGTLGLIWNLRNDAVEWVAALGRAMNSELSESISGAQDVPVDAPFGDIEARAWHWEHPMSADDVHAMVRSRSYYIASNDDFRARVDAGVSEVLAALGDGPILMPYVTHAFRAARP